MDVEKVLFVAVTFYETAEMEFVEDYGGGVGDVVETEKEGEEEEEGGENNVDDVEVKLSCRELIGVFGIESGVFVGGKGDAR